MAFNFSYTLNDPSAAVDPQDGIVEAALTQALGAWSQYVSGVGTLIVQLNLVPFGAPSATASYKLGEGGPTTETGIGQDGWLQLNQASSVHELLTGDHLAASDITVNINSQLLPGITNVQSYNLVEVFEHELMHGFGMVGHRWPDGSLFGHESAFDAQSVDNGTSSDFFIGAAAMGVYGGPVPLTTQVPGSNFYHLGATGTSADPAILARDLMSPYMDNGRTISALDVAILSDIGVPLTAAGYELFDPNPTLTAQSNSVDGASVTAAAISGTTQPGEQVTLSENGVVLGLTTADANGAWSIQPVNLAQGAQDLLASVPDASHLVTFGVGVVIDDTTPVEAIYTQVLGRVADPAGLAGSEGALQAGLSVAAIRTITADSVESETDIGQIYAATLGRWVDQASLVKFVQYLAGGGTQAAVRAEVAGSVESETDIGQIYAADLGRWVDQASLVGFVHYLAAGGTQATIRAEMADSAEAAAAIDAFYAAAMGRPASSADITGWQQQFAAGSSLSTLRSQLAASPEAATAINARYIAELGRPASTGDTTGWQQQLAAGSSVSTLQTELAASPEAAAAISNTYMTDLNRPASTADIAGWQQQLAAGGSLATLNAGALSSPEFAGAIAADYQAAAHSAPNAMDIAGDASEISSGVTWATLQTQIAQLDGGPAPREAIPFVPINPQMISGGGPSFVYGLLNNDSLLTAQPETVYLTTSGASGLAILNDFNPATDIIQVQAGQAANFAAIQNDSHLSGTATAILLTDGAEIYFSNVLPSQLSASNFRFA